MKREGRNHGQKETRFLDDGAAAVAHRVGDSMAAGMARLIIPHPDEISAVRSARTRMASRHDRYRQRDGDDSGGGDREVTPREKQDGIHVPGDAGADGIDASPIRECNRTPTEAPARQKALWRGTSRQASLVRLLDYEYAVESRTVIRHDYPARNDPSMAALARPSAEARTLRCR